MHCSSKPTSSSPESSSTEYCEQKHSGFPRVLMVTGLATVGLLLLSLVFRFSLFLAAGRIYSMDECSNVFVATNAASFARAGNLFLWALGKVVGGPQQSSDIFATGRLISLVVLWLNIVLLATATGERLFSRRWVLAFAGAVTLAPLWNSGIEILPQNALLTGLLLSWCILRGQTINVTGYFILGAVATMMSWIAPQGFVWTIPLALVALFFRPAEISSRKKSVGACMAGCCLSVIVLAVCFGTAGLKTVMISNGSFAAVGTNSLFQNGMVPKFLAQAPLAWALAGAGGIMLFCEIFRDGKAALNRAGTFPEATFMAIAFVLLAITRSPAQIVFVVSLGYLFGFRSVIGALEELWRGKAVRPVVVSVLLFAQVLPFVSAARWLLGQTNTRQEVIMRQAEEITDPRQDSLFDAVGLVPTRPVRDSRGAVVSLSLLTADSERTLEILKACPPAVIVPNPRTDALGKTVQEFFSGHYVSVADDFLVLGKVMGPGGGDFQVIHPGRYRFSTLEGSDLAGSYPEGWKGFVSQEKAGALIGKIDGRAIANEPVELTAGMHHVETAPHVRAAIVWVGPRLNRIHRMGRGDRRWLFSETF